MYDIEGWKEIQARVRVSDQVKLADQVRVQVVEAASIKVFAATPAISGSGTIAPRRDWFYTFTFFIPRAISEGWLGDIREKRATMAGDGYPRWIIEASTVSQFLLLGLHWIWRDLRDILTPFKNQPRR